MERLTHELETLRERKPDDKALIFTSFRQSIDWMCAELEKSGFVFRTLKCNMALNIHRIVAKRTVCIVKPS